MSYLGSQLVIRLRSVEDLARYKGGASGALFYKLAPEAVAKKAYSDMQREISDGLRSKGIEADVFITEDAGLKSHVSSPDLFTGAVLGAGAVGVSWILWKLILRFKK